MSVSVPTRDDPSLPSASLAAQVTVELTEFLDEHGAMLIAMHPDLTMLADATRAAVLAGGKRLRPTFAYWGWRTVQPAGHADEAQLVRAAASLELLQACALVHDDVMDASDIRRGQPAAHIRLGQLHTARGWPGSATSFGRSGAILLGDLLLSWAEEMFTAAIGGFASQARATAEFDLMRTEVVAGQFLDVLAQTRGAFDPVEALRVIEFKTSKYTVQRPLLLGAAAAAAPADVRRCLSVFGLALGEAFQLRDDLLGVWGDPGETGKPAGDDLREGKQTLLVAWAHQRADPAERELLRSGVGDPQLSESGVEQLRAVLYRTGARRRVEERIQLAAAAAGQALGVGLVAADADRALRELIDSAAYRTF